MITAYLTNFDVMVYDGSSLFDAMELVEKANYEATIYNHDDQTTLIYSPISGWKFDQSFLCLVSSAVEQLLYTEKAGGSIPSRGTIPQGPGWYWRLPVKQKVTGSSPVWGAIYGGQSVNGYMLDCESGVEGSLPSGHPRLLQLNGRAPD